MAEKKSYPGLPDEHPGTTAAAMRNIWLYKDGDRLSPESLLEFLQETDRIGVEWWRRWEDLWKKVNPTYFKNEEDRQEWVREQELKALAAWHVIRAMRMYWHKAGLWEGNPMDPNDAGKWLIEGFMKPKKKRKIKRGT